MLDAVWPYRKIEEMKLGDIVDEMIEIQQRSREPIPHASSIIYMRYLGDKTRYELLKERLSKYSI